MQNLPHKYITTATAEAEGLISLDSPSLPTLISAPPSEFGGPGDRWSPETLLTAAVADCIVLTFRAIARASRYEWISLMCQVEGELDRIDGSVEFTGFRINAELIVPTGANVDKGQRLLEKSKKGCLITNSLKANSELFTKVEISS